MYYDGDLWQQLYRHWSNQVKYLIAPNECTVHMNKNSQKSYFIFLFGNSVDPDQLASNEAS